MFTRRARVLNGIHLALAAVAISCGIFIANLPGTAAPSSVNQPSINGQFSFDPLAASAACTPGGNPSQPFLLPDDYTQSVIASQPQFPDLPDMHTLNENGPQAGRFLYRTHEVGSNGAVSVTDLWTGATNILVQRAEWGRLDGIAWTPWGSLLIAEERTGGLVYEIDPQTGVPVARPAVGRKSHEGMRFDSQGNLYSISETNPGYIFKFVPDVRSDLSSGQSYALRIVTATGDRTGEAEWVPLDRAQVEASADAAAAAVAATGYNRPEDVEIATSTGSNREGANVLYVAVTGPGDNRILGIDLREPNGGANHETAFVYDYVKVGLNATSDFEWPDNLALDKNGKLFIAEDPATATSTGRGDDIWVAVPGSGGDSHSPASEVVRFASLTDCSAEPTGIYFDLSGTTLFVHAQHRGGDGLDKAVAITRN
jgi:secreted PhoX family phosphatase